MAKRQRIWIFLISTLLSSAAFGQGTKRRVLFLGNSYTHVNNLPAMLAEAAASAGDTLEYDMYAPGGYTLDGHANDDQSINKIKAGGWDFVVLQEQSQKPALPSYSISSSIYLCNLVRQYNPCARPLFYRTWGRKNGDASFCSSWPPVCTYGGMDSLLHLRYLLMAQANHTEVSPVGAVWKSIRQQFPAIELYNADESHPSVAGSYAGACSFYASIFKKDPLSITYEGGLAPTEATSIRTAAHTVVYDSLDSWHFADLPPVAKFGYMAGPQPNEIQFLNQSLRARAYLWHFGDGDTSTLPSPGHVYAANGSYTVRLITMRCDLGEIQSDTIRKTIGFCMHTPTVFPDTIMLCTLNPDTLWTQLSDSYQWFGPTGDSIPGATQRYYVPSTSDKHSVRTYQNGCGELSAPAFVDALSSFNFYYISANSPDTICMGDTVLLILQPVTSPQPADADIGWFRNGLPIPFPGNDTLWVTDSGQYHAVVYDAVYCPGSPTFITSSVPLAFQNCAVEVAARKSSIPVSVYPNPGKDFTVRIPENWVGSPFKVTNMWGKTIHHGRLDEQENQLKMRDMPIGVYFLQVGGNHVLRLVRE